MEKQKTLRVYLCIGFGSVAAALLDAKRAEAASLVVKPQLTDKDVKEIRENLQKDMAYLKRRQKGI